jgi:DNA-binding XRE family transcriptional regulator
MADAMEDRTNWTPEQWQARFPERFKSQLPALRRRLAELDPQFEERVAVARALRLLGGQVYQLREAARLSHAELAEKVGATADDIEALEEGGYEGDALVFFARIASALGRDVELRTVQREPVAA